MNKVDNSSDLRNVNNQILHEIRLKTIADKTEEDNRTHSPKWLELR